MAGRCPYVCKDLCGDAEITGATLGRPASFSVAAKSKVGGAERGIGRLIIESEARGEASGMMVAVIVLMLVGVALSAVIWRLQAYLLRRQQHNMAE